MVDINARIAGAHVACETGTRVPASSKLPRGEGLVIAA
jgi:hypothetical protein